MVISFFTHNGTVPKLKAYPFKKFMNKDIINVYTESGGGLL